jgi:hypothetical protein
MVPVQKKLRSLRVDHNAADSFFQSWPPRHSAACV